MPDNPIPSSTLSKSQLARGAAWSGGLGASYLATEERHIEARTLAAQTRLLREHAAPGPIPSPSLRQRLTNLPHALIFRILPRFADVSRHSA